MPGIDFTLLRRQVPLAQVLELVGFRAVTRRGAQVRGPCPVHGSSSRRSRSLAAHLERHCWQCFRCGAKGNALDLIAGRLNLDEFDAKSGVGRAKPVGDVLSLPERERTAARADAERRHVYSRVRRRRAAISERGIGPVSRRARSARSRSARSRASHTGFCRSGSSARRGK